MESSYPSAAGAVVGARLVVVEDDPITRLMIARYFTSEGMEVEQAASAAECWNILDRFSADLLFIDIQLPDANGIALAQEIRRSSSAGIIFVTRKDSDVDRVVGLESAGDDYVTKPVKLRELLARARALLRRRQPSSQSPLSHTILQFGTWTLDLTRRELMCGEKQIAITRGEFDLLAALTQADGRPLWPAALQSL